MMIIILLNMIIGFIKDKGKGDTIEKVPNIDEKEKIKLSVIS